jgi:hypothetical protein
MDMPMKLKKWFMQDDPLLNLFKMAFILAALVALIIFFSNASTARDFEWYKTGFDERPNKVIVYHDGQKTEYEAGQPGFAELSEAVRATLAQGVARESNIGLSPVSQEEAYTRYTTVEAFFAVPVKLHAPFYTGYPTQMLFPITGRHSDFTIVFLSAGDAYWVNAPLLKTTQPLLDALKALGY